MPWYSLKQIESDTGLKYDYLRKCLKQIGEAFQPHAKKSPGKGWQFDEQGIELFRQIAGLKESGLDLPQIKKQLALLGYLDASEASEPSGVGDSGQANAASSPSSSPAPRTGEDFVLQLMEKVDKANDKMEEFREKQFAKDRRMLKHHNLRLGLLAQVEHIGFWSLLVKRKGIVAQLRQAEEKGIAEWGETEAGEEKEQPRRRAGPDGQSNWWVQWLEPANIAIVVLAIVASGFLIWIYLTAPQ